MRFEIITIFPEFFAGPLDYGIVRRAREARIADVRVHDLRAFAHDRHRTVDDRPFGGGEGMVLKPEPLFEAVESLLGQEIFSGTRAECDSKNIDSNVVESKSKDDASLHPIGTRFTVNVHRERHAVPPPNEWTPIAQAGTAIVLLSASGKLFRQETARRLAQLDRIILLCGRYEGVDERVTEHLATDEISIGDYVLSGGELGAALILDSVTRLLPGALGNEDSTINESFSAVDDVTYRANFSTSHQSPVTSHVLPATSHLLLDYPHYTRPADFRGWTVPEILLGGNHEEIRKWRQKKALEKTLRNRPDLLTNNISV